MKPTLPKTDSAVQDFHNTATHAFKYRKVNPRARSTHDKNKRKQLLLFALLYRKLPGYRAAISQVCNCCMSHYGRSSPRRRLVFRQVGFSVKALNSDPSSCPSCTVTDDTTVKFDTIFLRQAAVLTLTGGDYRRQVTLIEVEARLAAAPVQVSKH